MKVKLRSSNPLLASNNLRLTIPIYAVLQIQVRRGISIVFIQNANYCFFSVLQHEPTMMRLLGALGLSTGSSVAMLLGKSTGAGAATELDDMASIPDATFQLLTTLTKKASNRTLVLNPLYQYLSACKNRYLTS